MLINSDENYSDNYRRDLSLFLVFLLRFHMYNFACNLFESHSPYKFQL